MAAVAANATPANAQPSSSSCFWCHACTRHVDTRDDDASGELCCVSCGGNFVEEVEADDPPEQFLAVAAPSAEAAGTAGATTSPTHTTAPSAARTSSHDPFAELDRLARDDMMPTTPRTNTAAAPRATTTRDAPSPLTELLQQLVGAGGAAGAAAEGGAARPTARTARIMRSNGTPVEFYVTSTSDIGDFAGGGGLFGLLSGAMGGGGGFASNPGDYALGPNHLSQLINQLMQNDPNRHGAPPAAKEVVEKLPKHKVVQTEVDANAECAVCKDLFAVDDDAQDLPCSHSFHPDCITPWLKMHNSCPVCRFELPTDDQEYEGRRRDQQEHERHEQQRSQWL